MKALYHRIGGVDTLQKINQKMFQSLLLNPEIADVHLKNKSNIAKMHDSMVDFLCSLTGGPLLYSGSSMIKVHQNLNLNKAHFDYIWKSIEKAAIQLEIQQALIDQLKQCIYGVQNDVLYSQSRKQ